MVKATDEDEYENPARQFKIEAFISFVTAHLSIPIKVVIKEY